MKRSSPTVAACTVLLGYFLIATMPLNLFLMVMKITQGGGWGTVILELLKLVLVCVTLFVPASILTLGAGAIYGLGVGVGVVLAGATLGATISFLLARTLLRDRIEHMTRGNARFRALDRAIAKEGTKIVFLVRLAPVFPFTYINYAFGLTGVATLPYVVASLVGMTPAHQQPWVRPRVIDNDHAGRVANLDMACCGER